MHIRATEFPTNGFDFFVQAVMTASNKPKPVLRKVELQRKGRAPAQPSEFKEETLNGVAVLDEITGRPQPDG